MRVVRGLFYFVLAFACVMLLASPAAAQFDRGTISGVVKDQSGGVVPGATGVAFLRFSSIPTPQSLLGGVRCVL